MPYYDAMTGMEVETADEIAERKRKEAEEAAKRAGETPVAKTETTVYEDGSKTHTTTQETPAPSLFDRGFGAVKQLGTNFVNNLTNAPENFVRNIESAVTPGQQKPQPQAQPAATPQLPAAAGPVAPTNYSLATGMGGPGFRMPNGQTVPQEPQAATTSPVAPAQITQRPLPQDYNATIAAQESGNRPNIGYHNPALSSAYGQYGITNAAYQDARKLNPNLPADITQATPEQQTQAMTAFTQQNAKYLQGYGIEPTANNLSAAHLLGAKGLNDYLRNGTFSPAAIQANGGEEKLRSIVNSRLAGQPAAASGATGQPTAVPGPGVAVATGQGVQGTTAISPEQQAQQEAQLAQQQAAAAPQPQTRTPLAQHIDYYQSIQGDKNALMKYAMMEGAPEYLKERARNQFADKVDQERKLAAAEEEIKNNPGKVGQFFNKRSTDGSIGDWAQYLLFKAVGLEDLANDKGEKLGIGHNWQNATIIDADGNERGVEVLTSRNGRVIQGNFAGTNERLDKEQLGQAASGILGKGVHITKVNNLIDPATKQLVTHQTLSNGKERYTAGGKPFTGDRSKLQDAGEHIKQEDRRVNAGYTNLGKLTDNPTPQQRYEALRNAGVSPDRIEQELGLSKGSLSKGAPTGGTPAPAGGTPAPAGGTPAPAAPAAAPAQAQAGKTVGTTVLPSGRPFDPNRAPEALPGQSKTAHGADVKAWEARKKSFDKDVEAYSGIESAANQTLADADRLLAHPGLPRIVGITGAFPSIPGTDAANAQSDLDKIKGGTFLTALRSMKGSGSVSNVEGDKAQAAIANLAQKQDEAQFRKSVQEYKNTVMRSANAAAAAIGEPPPYPGVPKAGSENTGTGTTSSGNKFKRVQ